MKLLGTLLLWASLVVGILAAATGYLVPLDLPNDELIGLTLNAPAGVIESGEKRRPLVEKKAKLDDRALAELRTNKVSYVLVQEFSFARWPGKWAFLLGVAGLIGAAVLLKRSAKQAAATAAAAAPGEGADAALDAGLADVEALLQTLRTLPPEEGLTQAREQLQRVQQTHFQAFIEARPQLLERLGLLRFADVMGCFASGERQVHRAWSAAADGIYEEVLVCLEEARHTLAQAQERLK